LSALVHPYFVVRQQNGPVSSCRQRKSPLETTGYLSGNYQDRGAPDSRQHIRAARESFVSGGLGAVRSWGNAKAGWSRRCKDMRGPATALDDRSTRLETEGRRSCSRGNHAPRFQRIGHSSDRGVEADPAPPGPPGEALKHRRRSRSQTGRRPPGATITR
jgi:hypothetical protein